ncbi:MAG: ABC transporter substrate-binding protein [Ruminococcaceae bacterium]|nr:ABC transporter substrate-binding protein [Oscillospiraceae bacterium]
MKAGLCFKKILTLLMTTLLFFLCGCGGNGNTEHSQNKLVEYENQNESAVQGGILRLAMTDVQTLQPVVCKNQHNLYVYKLIFDSLFVTAPNHSIEPVLCENYIVSPDGLTYTFQMKHGVSFHNGARFTANDVEATLSMIMSTDGLYRQRLSCISAYSSQGMSLTISLHYPVINFPALLDFPIMSRDDISTGANEYVPNGTGRYKVQSYKKSKELHLSHNENYHQDFSPYISDITVYLLNNAETAVSMLETMQIDVLPSGVINLHEYTPKRSLSSTEFFGGKFTFLGINNQHPAFLTPLTRHALASSINRQDLLADCAIQYASEAFLPLPQNSFWHKPTTENFTHDVNLARQLLVDDGWIDKDSNGILEKEVYGEQISLTFNILVNEENQNRQKIAEQLKEHYQEIGIPVTIISTSFGDYEARIAERNYDLFIGEIDFSQNFDLSFLLKTNENYFGISNERLDQILNALYLQDSELSKQSLFYELCDVLSEEVPIIGLFYEYEQLIFDQRVRGSITPSYSDIFYGIEGWFLYVK